MTDFLAGQELTTLHFTPTVGDTQNDNYQLTITSYGNTSSGGTFVTCGVAFVGPATGRVMVHFAASLDNSAAASTSVSPFVRTGTTVGSGTTVLAAAIEHAVLNIGTDERHYGSFVLVEGLTPGSDYNVRLEHRVSSGTGFIQYRRVAVSPCT